jgi:hypothetical protein
MDTSHFKIFILADKDLKVFNPLNLVYITAREGREKT